VVCICLSHNIAGKMAARRGLYLFVTYIYHMVCICLLHIVAVKMAAPRGLYLFVTYCSRQDDGAKWFICTVVHVQYSSRALIIHDNNNIYVLWMM
jgi:hypothetical protein